MRKDLPRGRRSGRSVFDFNDNGTGGDDDQLRLIGDSMDQVLRDRTDR